MMHLLLLVRRTIEYLKADYFALQCLNVDSPEDIVNKMRDSYTIDSVKSEFKESDKNVAASNESSIIML